MLLMLNNTKNTVGVNIPSYGAGKCKNWSCIWIAKNVGGMKIGIKKLSKAT